MSEPRAAGQSALDSQALQQHAVRLPQLDQQALELGDYVPQQGPDPFARDQHDRDADQAIRDARRDAAQDGLRSLAEAAARGAGADPALARRVGDEMARLAPVEPAEPVQRDPEPEQPAGDPDPEPPAAAELAAEPELTELPKRGTS